MSQVKRSDSKQAPQILAEPAKLAGDYLRSFTQSLAEFSDFDNFLETLKRLVGEDSYLKGSAELCDPFKDVTVIPDFESLNADETVIAVANQAGNNGYLKYSGRADARPFGTEDLHLMSAVAGMVSSLVAEAQNYRKKEQAAHVLQFLINQLPSIRCLTRTPCGCLWHSPIMHYRLEGCRPHFLVLHRCRLPVNLRWDLGRVNKRWSRPSMEWRLSTDGDDHLGSGHDVDGCCLCIVRYRGNSSCWLGL